MLGKRLINTGPASSACTTDTLDLEGMPSGGETNVAVYKLDGNATDVTGNYNGNLVAGSYVTGKFGQAASFNGSSTYMTIGNPVASNIYSFSIWVKPTVAIPSGLGAIIGGSGTTLTYYQHNNGSLLIYNGGSYLEATNFFQDTNWVHLVAVSNGSNLLIYRNGALFATLGASITLNSITFGKHPLYAVEYFNGSLDQIRIFNKVLDSTEANTLYNETVATTSTLLFPNPSIVAYYKLDSTAADVTGNYNGTASNVTYTNSGQFSQAAVFDGSTTKIDIPSVFGIGNIASFSVSLWAKSTNNGLQEWFGGKTTRFLNNHNFTIGQYNAGNQIRVFCGSDANTWLLSQTSNVFFDGLWHNYTFVKDGTNGYFYIDGQLFDSANVFDSSTTLDPNGDEYIGAVWNGTPRFNGSIDQVRIYNQALSQANVDTLFNEVQCPCTTDTVDYPTTNVAYYKLDGNAQDSTTNGYDGTATNVTYSTGKFGQAGNFKALQGYIVTPVGVYSNSFSGHSVSFWMKSGGTSYETPIYTRTGSAAAGWHIRTSTGGNGINWAWQNSSGGSVFASGEEAVTLTDGWHHVVALWDGTTNANGAKLYIDGVLFDELTANATLASQSFSLGITLGADRQSSGRSILGLDQVRIFDTALTAAQVTDLYDEVYCKPPPLDFETTLYTGTGNNQTIYNSGFQPDLVWVKNRTEAINHTLFDTVRGSGQYLRTDLAEGNVSVWSSYGVHFDVTDGFVVKDDANGGYYVNKPSVNYVAWQWKAGGNTSTFNIDDVGYATASAAGLDSGTINPTGASIGTSVGFSILKYTGTGVDGTLAHGLNAKPELWIFKNLSAAKPWFTLTNVIDGSVDYALLNTTDIFNNAGQGDATTTVLTVNNDGGSGWLNASGNEYIAYAWHSVAGHSKIGSYIGNGSSQVIPTDFQARFILIKTTTSAGLHWYMLDSNRDGSTTNINQILEANLVNAEVTSGSININFNTSNITINSSSPAVNANGQGYIYMAFA